MDAKKLLLITGIALLSFIGISTASAGPTSTSFGGPMSCYIPTLLEIKSPITASAVGATDQQEMNLQQTSTREGATVITVCAK